jgi:transposase-like protein
MPKETTDLPPNEVTDPAEEKRPYRKFSAEEKLRILTEADQCKEPGQLGELLRKEQIYSSHLTKWRRQLQAQGQAGLKGKPSGRKPSLDKRDKEIAQLKKENQRLSQRLQQTEGVIALQIKAFSLLEQMNTEISL